MSKEDRIIKKAIHQIAAEHLFFTELQDYLSLVKKQFEEAKRQTDQKQIKAGRGMVSLTCRVIFSKARLAGIAEKRFNRYEREIENLLEKIDKGTFSATSDMAKKLRERLHVEAANLLKDASLYEGRIRSLILGIQNYIDSDTAKLEVYLEELRKTVDDAEKWVAAVAVDLNEAESVVKRYEDPYWNNLSNYHTIHNIKALMESMGIEHLKISFAYGMITIEGFFGSRSYKPSSALRLSKVPVPITISQNPDPNENSIIKIRFSKQFRLERPGVEIPLFDQRLYEYDYNLKNSKRSFKKILKAVLQIIDNTIRKNVPPKVPVSRQLNKLF